MALTFTEQYEAPTLLHGCGPKGITCYGGNTMLACLEEVGRVPDGLGGWTPETYDLARIVRSLDNGVTWTPLEPILTQSLWFYQAYCPVLGRIVIGTSGPDYAPGESTGIPDAGAVVSNDGGVTWAQAFPDWTYLWWETYGIGQLDADTLMTIGLYEVDNGAGGYTPYDMAISHDGGLTFSEFRLINWDEWWTSIAVCDDGAILLGSEQHDTQGVIYRSVDGGTTFTPTYLYCTQHGLAEGDQVNITDVADLGGGICLATGWAWWEDGVGGQAQRLWRSVDSGATWAEITGSLAGENAQNVPTRLAVWGDGLHACLIGPVGSIAYTEDGGLTWAASSIPSAGASARMFYANIADDGSICGTVYDTADANAYKIWRAVPTWTVPGPCYQAAPPTPTPTPLPGPGGAVPTGPCPQADLIYERRGI